MPSLLPSGPTLNWSRLDQTNGRHYGQIGVGIRRQCCCDHSRIGTNCYLVEVGAAAMTVRDIDLT